MATTQTLRNHIHTQKLVLLQSSPTLDFNDVFIAVYCFIRNFIGVTDTNTVIDSKIEQAMEIIKNQLMYIMREEVEVLRDRIAVLIDRIKHLENENNFLKANVSADVYDRDAYSPIEFSDGASDKEEELAAIIADVQNGY